MEETIAKFENEAKELKKSILQQAIENDIDFTDTEDEDAVSLMRCMKFLDATYKLMVEQSRAIDKINKKLDVLVTVEGWVE